MMQLSIGLTGISVLLFCQLLFLNARICRFKQVLSMHFKIKFV
jgi:hypothetical protein